MTVEFLAESLTEDQWRIAHAIAQTLVNENVDVNELGKAIAYLRAFVNRKNAGTQFFNYLKTLVKNGTHIGHSQRTSEYYESLEKACRQNLKAYENDAPKMLQILGWAFRLMRYYQQNAEPIGEILAPKTESVRQAEIAKFSSAQNFTIGHILEAKVTAVKGNKVTYEILGTIKLTEKDPKKAPLLCEGKTVQIEILDLKEDGSLKKVRCSD